MPRGAQSDVLRYKTPVEEAWSVTRSGGAVFIRSANSAEPEPADWRERLAASIGTLHDVVAVGAKRLGGDGTILAMGDFIIHSKGFHHLGRGVEPDAYRFPEEVDAVSGGVLAVDEPAFDRAGGTDLLKGPLGCIELCLALRSAGGRCIVVPEVIVCDPASPLDEGALAPEDDAAFTAKWGFDWRAADLDEVRRRHGDTGLMWNVRFFGQAMPFAKYDRRPCMHWKSYSEVEVYRRRADSLTQIVRDAAPKGTPPARILDLGCGDGLFTHLLARTGVQAIGVDAEAGAVAQAAARTAEEAAGGAYPGPAPEFQTGRGEALPFDSDSLQTVAMLDVIEHLPNPVSVLREVQRVLLPGGLLVISTPAWQFGGSSDPVYHVCEYTLPELVQQIHAATELRVLKTGRIGGPYRDLIVVAQK
ncbi:MAG: methyltransferase domain-containing protein [Phycisphaerales bacterium]|nr:MAG: methyltransferase domain-containing protein [Phycisphaerales bacterium]